MGGRNPAVHQAPRHALDGRGSTHQSGTSSDMTVAKTKKARAGRDGNIATNPTSPGRVLNAIDPATGRVIGTVPVTTEEQIPAIVARACRPSRIPFASAITRGSRQRQGGRSLYRTQES